LKLELTQISQQIRDVARDYENIAVSDDVIQEVEELVEAELESSNCQATTYAESQIEGLKVIVPLLTGDKLTQAQKTALHKMLMQQVKP
jgi:hypothetical protein